MNLDPIGFIELVDEIIGQGNSIRFRVHGGSMHPFIRDNDVIEVKPINGSESRLGDVLLYRTPQKGMVAHRLVKKQGENESVVLVTKGDSLLNLDRPVLSENVLGKVVAIESGKRKTNLDNPLGRLTNLFLAKTSTFSPRIHSVIGKAKRALRKVLGGVSLMREQL